MTDPSPLTRRGYKRGEPLRYIKGHSSRKTGPDYQRMPRRLPAPEDGDCWMWLKSIGSEGYGRIWKDDRHVMAHRVYYETHVGPIAPGHEVHHICGVRACVNPGHLTQVTRAEHMAIEGRCAYGNPRAKVAA